MKLCQPPELLRLLVQATYLPTPNSTPSIQERETGEEMDDLTELLERNYLSVIPWDDVFMNT